MSTDCVLGCLLRNFLCQQLSAEGGKNKQEAPHPPLANPCPTPDSVCSAVLKVILCNEGNDTRAEFRELPRCLSKLPLQSRRRMTGGRKGRTFYNVCSCRRARQRRRQRRQQHETMSPPLETPSYAARAFLPSSTFRVADLALFGHECTAVGVEERQTSPWDVFFSRFLLFLFPPFSLLPFFFSSCLDRFRAGWDCDYEGRDGRVPPLSQRCSQEDRA